MADRAEVTPGQLLQRVTEVYGDVEAEGPRRALEQTEALGSETKTQRAVDVATLLLDLRLDAPTVTAAILLGGVADHTEPGPLEEAYGAEVRGLIEGVGRLERIQWDHLEREASENLRKMFLAMASDIRVVLIALADRVHEMRHLDSVGRDYANKRARETMDVFAPLANRLGIWQVKWELEDLAFRALQPDTYREVGKMLAEKRAARRASIDEVISVLQQKLAEAGIPAEIKGRPKHIYSIYKKMQRKGLGFEEIYDVSAVRVLVEELGQCYAVLGLVHGLWTPIAGEFDDYVAKPKSNFYRSLHTAVVGPGGRSLEVQIRTREMHEQSEYGIAAHWRYKEGKKANRRFDEKINWLRQLMEWQKEVTDPADFAASLKSDVFQEQVYVFTPTGEVLDLPTGATPIDFAYRIHTQVGHRCRGAKVDGNIVPLDYELRTGERVEIITAKNGKPSRDWLNPHLGYVKTASAKAKIRSYFREQARDTSIAQGRELVDREIKRLGVDGFTHDDVALACDFDDTTEFLARLGFGDVSVQHVANRLLEAERERKQAAAPPEPTFTPKPPTKRMSAGVSIGGVDDVMSTPANCCHPVPGDPVIGYITRGRGLMIHRRDCPNVKHHPEPERLMELDWGVKLGEVYPVDVQVFATDRAGLLRDIADVVTREGVNMRSATADRQGKDGTAVLVATLEIRGSDQLLRVLSRLEQLPYVQGVRRVAR